MTMEEGFDTGGDPGSDAQFVLDLDGYEGPIDVLLTLARDQKVDLTKLSILDLADQYLAFVARARRLRLELAADYLVMAAWLAYLKSRLLLPEAMQRAGAQLMALPGLGRDFFVRGEPERVQVVARPVYRLTLYELLKAYGAQAAERQPSLLRIPPHDLYSMDDALHRIGGMLGHTPDWHSLFHFLPPGMHDGLRRRAALAATFAASLELVRSGRAELRQDGTFGPIYLRPAPNPAE